MRRRSVLAALATVALPARLRAADPPPPLRIGVLGDPTGIGASASGSPTVVAAQMAATDFGPLPSGQAVQIVGGEFRLKPDDALAIARHWFDDLGVSAIFDLPTSAAAAAVQDLARTRNRTVLNTSSINPALSGSSCAAIATEWAIDTVALGNTVARGLAAGGAKTWYLIVPDTAITLAIQRDASKAIEAAGGRVIGLSQHPSGVPDFTSPVTEARQSGAQAVGLCGIGDDLSGTLRQARTAGLFTGTGKLAAFMASISDVHAVGGAAAQGLLLADGFYWNDNAATRLFATRFNAAAGRMPDISHAATYTAVLHYLRAVVAADTLDAVAVNNEMRRTPVYFFGRNGRIRLDGRVTFDMTLYRVRAPAATDNDWDCYEQVRSIPAAEAFRPAGQGGCVLAP
jgi:branched-chain amino acid transport system substrate-binding protein